MKIDEYLCLQERDDTEQISGAEVVRGQYFLLIWKGRVMRKRIFEIIEVAGDNDRLSKVYDSIMMVFIIISLIPIAAKSTQGIYGTLDIVTTGVFIVDYVLRLLTADYKLKKGYGSFIIYPITPMAVADLLAILPSLLPVNGAFRILKIFRLLRTLRVFRVLKVIRYSKSISIIIEVFRKQKESLLVVCGLAVGYILVSALVVISVEPETFPTFFDAIYWATVSLTTVGYGDIFAVSAIGRVITMLSAVLGIAIVALPAGIIMAGYMDALNESKQMKDIKDQRTNEEFIREALKLSDEDQTELTKYIKYLKYRKIG